MPGRGGGADPAAVGEIMLVLLTVVNVLSLPLQGL